MKLKKIYLISTLLLVILFQSNVLNTNASIKPYIINNNKSFISTNQNSVPLTWTVIDDNPNYYQILQNGSILQNNIKIMSDLISYDFTSVTGIYNISLIVHDYSGYVAQSSTIIDLVKPAVTSATSSGITQQTVTEPATTFASTAFKGTPGYTYILTLFTFIIITLMYIIKRSKTKRS